MLAGCRLQYAESRRQPAHLMALATTPLFTAMFLSITLHAGDRRAVVYAVIAPGLINLWFLSLDLGGESVSRERWQGTLELCSPLRRRWSRSCSAGCWPSLGWPG